MKEHILIPRKEHFAQIEEALITGGASNLHIISDFDRTLTSGRSHGKLSGSVISILRDKHYLTPDYPQRAHDLADYYRPIEKDPLISLEEKKASMMEWWERHFELLLECGLTRQHIEKAMQESGVELRDGAEELIRELAIKKIPLVIFSASGLGYDSINYFLSHRGLMSDNVHIVSNRFKWDKDGRSCGIIYPIIHSFNKDEHSLHDLPFYAEIARRKNVILLGDSLGDLGMASGLSHDNILKVCFPEDVDPQTLATIESGYDLIIKDDGSMEYVIDLVKKIE